MVSLRATINAPSIAADSKPTLMDQDACQGYKREKNQERERERERSNQQYRNQHGQVVRVWHRAKVVLKKGTTLSLNLLRVDQLRFTLRHFDFEYPFGSDGWKV